MTSGNYTRNSAADVNGLFDLHVHAGPDVRPRKADYLEVAAAARAAGMAGLLFKSHVTLTSGAAALTAAVTPGLKVYGGLVLNREVGGFNPAAVEAALKTGARQIWMPTLSARHHLRIEKQPGNGLSILDHHGRVKPVVSEILTLVRQADAILGTGHLSPQEIHLLIQAARQAKLRKILVTHADFRLTALSADSQRELCEPGVYFERCYLAIGRGVDWDQLSKVIRAVGVVRSVLATDLGQPDNSAPLDGMVEMVRQLRRRGFNQAEIRTMGSAIPTDLLA